MRVFVTTKANEITRQLNTRQAEKHAKFSAKISLKSPIPQNAIMDRRGVAAGTAFGAAQRWLRVVQTGLVGHQRISASPKSVFGAAQTEGGGFVYYRRA